MSEIQERQELRRLVDGMTDEQVRTVLDTARQVSEQTPTSDDDLAWIGCIVDGPADLSVRSKDILRNEMGVRHRHGPAA